MVPFYISYGHDSICENLAVSAGMMMMIRVLRPHTHGRLKKLSDLQTVMKRKDETTFSHIEIQTWVVVISGLTSYC